MSVLFLPFLFSFLSLTTSYDVQSGAGYSLSFQSLNSGSDIATLWNYFDCASYWPTTQIALSFWIRCLSADVETSGIFCGSSIFVESYIKKGGYNHVYSTLVTMDQGNINTILQNVGAKFPAWLDFFNWHMYTFQSDTVAGTSSLYIDGALFATINTTLPTFAFCNPTLSGTLLTIGRNFFLGTETYVQQAQGRGFFGEIDEISMWNRTLSSSEISSMYTTKLRGDEHGLLTYWDFNEGNGLVAKNLAFTGSAYDLHLGQTKNAHVYLDATSNTITDLTAPSFAPSTIPIAVNQANGLYSANSLPIIVVSVLQPNSSTFINFNTSNYPTVNSIQILNSPLYGDLYQSPDGVSRGAHITSFPATVSSSQVLVYQVPSEPLFNDSSNVAFDSFSYVLLRSDSTTITNGTVHCIPNDVPNANNLTLTAQSGLTLFTSPATINERGGLLQWKILTVPQHGTLHQVFPNGSIANVVAPNDYLSHAGGYFAYIPPQVGGGAGFDNFSYVAHDPEGSDSSITDVIFNVNAFDYLPTTINEGIILNENSEVVIDLQTIDLDGQLVATSISKLPAHGKLYFYNDNGTRGAEITKVANPYDGVTVQSSYASAVTGVSSFWGAGGASYSPWQILGPQDVFTYGDSALTWCPLTLTGDGGYASGGANGLNFSWDPTAAYTQYGYTEYIELSFNISVYAISVQVGMCRGMGSLVNVKAMSPLGWESIWSSPASKQILQDSAASKKYYTYSISLCQSTYRTNALRLEYDTRDVGDWAETDYVQFVGATDLRPAVFEWNKTQVVYVPNPNYYGPDTFEYLANDCPYTNLRDSTPGVINITVNKIDVPPVITPVQSTVTLGNDMYIYLQNSSEEVNGGVISKYTILTLPKYGKLYSVDDNMEITQVPVNITGGTLKYSAGYWQWEGSTTVSFNYTVYAALASKEVATVTIYFNIPTPENPALAWIVFITVIFLTGAAYPLLMSRHNTYPLRTTSYALNMVATTGTLLFANIPLQIIAFSNYPCWLYYFCYMLGPAIFTTPILVALYRHHHIYQLTRIKRRIAKADKHGGSQTRHGARRAGPTTEDLEHVAYLKQLTSDPRLLGITALGLVVPLIISLALIPTATGTFGYTYCHMGSIVEICFLLYWIIYTTALFVGLYLVRNDHELTGFRKHIFYTALASVLVGILYIIVFGVTISSGGFASFALLFVVVPCIYQFLAITRPAIQTFPFLRRSTKSTQEEGGEPLSEVIITQSGFAWYLEFTMAEFSQESPLAWKAISNFKSKTSYDGMREIYAKYFVESAPLLVNLSSGSLRELRALIERTTSDTPMQQLQSIYDIVQMELLELMQQDSYMRFISSDYYQKYKRHEPVPHADPYTSVSAGSPPKDDLEIPSFSKPLGKIVSSPESSQHDPLAVSGSGGGSKETSRVGRDSIESKKGDEKLNITIPNLHSRPDSPDRDRGGSRTPSTSALNEPSFLGSHVEMTGRQSFAEAHDRHETVVEETEAVVEETEDDADQGKVL